MYKMYATNTQGKNHSSAPNIARDNTTPQTMDKCAQDEIFPLLKPYSAMITNAIGMIYSAKGIENMST